MADNQTSPFAGLDKALLRSTKPSPPPHAGKEEPPAEEEQGAFAQPRPAPTNRPPDEPVLRRPDEATNRPPDRAAGDYELIRRGFEWYAYQLRKLKKLSLKEQMEGKPGSMSAMLRDALDDYLKKEQMSFNRRSDRPANRSLDRATDSLSRASYGCND
jgi:hypothetical protein